MNCGCKEVRKVKSCPTVSVEETILTELRNFYNYVVAKFTALFALPVLENPEVTYAQQSFSLAPAGQGTFDVPAKTLCLIIEIADDIANGTGAGIALTAPGSAGGFLLGNRGVHVISLSPKYHTAGEWIINNGTIDTEVILVTIISEA